MNASGGTEPWRGSFQRASASKRHQSAAADVDDGLQVDFDGVAIHGAAQILLEREARVNALVHGRVEHLHVVAAACLGFVQRDVGRTQQLAHRRGIARVDRKANAGGGGVGGFAQAHGLLQCGGNPLGDRRAVGFEAVVARDHEEFIAAHAHHEIGARDGVAQSSRDRSKVVVTDRVAARIVDVLEVVAVDVKDGQRIAATRGFIDEPRKLFVEERAVREPGQRVVRGQVLQRQLVFLRAALGLAAMRDVLQQHGVDATGAGIQIHDREFHVAALVVAADELRGAVLGGLFGIAGRRRHRRVEDGR